MLSEGTYGWFFTLFIFVNIFMNAPFNTYEISMSHYQSHSLYNRCKNQEKYIILEVT